MRPIFIVCIDLHHLKIPNVIRNKENLYAESSVLTQTVSIKKKTQELKGRKNCISREGKKIRNKCQGYKTTSKIGGAQKVRQGYQNVNHKCYHHPD
jgi:hypothetical protein